MKIIFSRKGFDSSAGGGPSPIVDGRTLSLPIPDSAGISRTSFAALGLDEHARRASRGKLLGTNACHNDPMFLPNNRALLGQCGAAQTHLVNNKVGEGDLFLFFGLFREDSCAPYHRIFGFLKVKEAVDLATCSQSVRADLAALDHPHALAMHGRNDMIYCGRGATGARALEELRLTVPEGPPSLWQVPGWLRRKGLSYHGREDRWMPDNRLQSVARGQEFVTDIADCKVARDWAARIISLIEA